MKRVLLDIVICPECKSDALDTRIERQEADEVISGEIACKACGRAYMIEEGIPRFLTEEIDSLADNLSHGKVIRLAEESKAAGVKAANILYHDLAADEYEIRTHSKTTC